MKIFNLNSNIININFKNNNLPKLPNLNMFGANFSNPLVPLDRDVFVSQQLPQDEEDILTDVDKRAFDLAFQSVKGEIGPEAQALWRLNFALSFYIEMFHDRMASIKRENLDLDFYNDFVLNIFSEETREDMKEYLKKSEIDTFSALQEVAKVYSPTKVKYPEVQDKGLDFIYACAYLAENKKELANFPSIFMEAAKNSLYLQEEYNLYDYGFFVQDLGIKNENAFLKKFAHLAPKFNNFADSDDRLAAFEYVYKTYDVKGFALSELIRTQGYLADKDESEIYMAHCDIIDYLYEEEASSWVIKINRILAQCENQDALSSRAIEAVADLVDATSPKGKIELYDFLYSENISINELNHFAKSDDYLDLKPLDFVINRNDIVEKLALLDEFDENTAQEFYLRFHQILNALFTENNKKQGDTFKTLIKIIQEFDIKNDKEFLKFYSGFENSSIKQTKGKKVQNAQRKPKAQFVADFVELFAFSNEDLIKKYKKDKHFPLKSELQKRRAQFEKIKPQMEKQISQQGVANILTDAQEVFVEYENLLKANPNIGAFVKKVAELKAQQSPKKTQTEKTRLEFLAYFKDEKLLDEFLLKNNIVINDTKESRVYCETCLRILGDIFDFKTQQEQQKALEKLMKNDFIANANTSLIKFARKKDDMELEILFDIILSENISSLSQINTILNRYKGKDDSISAFLMNFKNYYFTFSEYVNRLEIIQKEFDNAGIPIKINSDNVSAIDLEEYGDGKIADSKLALLANNILNPYSKGNFINALSASKTKEAQHINSNMIAKEILLSMSGRYEQEYSNLVEKFNIDKEALVAQLSNNNMTMVGISAIDNRLVELLNSPVWCSANEEGDEIYNLSLHAKMRLLDRFIFDKPNSSDMSKNDIEKELKDILATIYLKNPTKIHKAEGETFVAYFNHNDFEIKAVFEKNGQMLTIIKR